MRPHRGVNPIRRRLALKHDIGSLIPLPAQSSNSHVICGRRWIPLRASPCGASAASHPAHRLGLNSPSTAVPCSTSCNPVKQLSCGAGSLDLLRQPFSDRGCIPGSGTETNSAAAQAAPIPVYQLQLLLALVSIRQHAAAGLHTPQHADPSLPHPVPLCDPQSDLFLPFPARPTYPQGRRRLSAILWACSRAELSACRMKSRFKFGCGYAALCSPRLRVDLDPPASTSLLLPLLPC